MECDAIPTPQNKLAASVLLAGSNQNPAPIPRVHARALYTHMYMCHAYDSKTETPNRCNDGAYETWHVKLGTLGSGQESYLVMMHFWLGRLPFGQQTSHVENRNWMRHRTNTNWKTAVIPMPRYSLKSSTAEAARQTSRCKRQNTATKGLHDGKAQQHKGYSDGGNPYTTFAFPYMFSTRHRGGNTRNRCLLGWLTSSILPLAWLSMSSLCELTPSSALSMFIKTSLVESMVSVIADKSMF